MPSEHRSTAVLREDSLGFMVTGHLKYLTNGPYHIKTYTSILAVKGNENKVCLGHRKCLILFLPLLESNCDQYQVQIISCKKKVYMIIFPWHHITDVLMCINDFKK